MAGDVDATGAHSSLCRLCEKYWYPVYAFLRRSGHDPNAAEDLTQAFFVDLIEGNKLAAADSERGRFRSFLLTACRNFASNVRRGQRTLKAGGGKKQLPLDVDVALGENRYQQRSVDSWSPEQLFDRQWALQLLDLAIDQIANDYAARNQTKQFDALKPFIAPAGDLPRHVVVAETLGISVGAVKTAVHRLRQRFAQTLQEQVSETLSDRDEIKDELKILLDALGGQ